MRSRSAGRPVHPVVVHKALIEAARRITVPVQFLLPWNDEHVERQSALALFDAFASKEKTLHANLAVSAWVDTATNPGESPQRALVRVDNEFLARDLSRVDTSPA
jgi:hypothetical protein